MIDSMDLRDEQRIRMEPRCCILAPYGHTLGCMIQRGLMEDPRDRPPARFAFADTEAEQ
jgi:hypothetical protein